jgi:hypothetical protein
MENQFMGIIFTNHALERLRQRRITQSDAWYTLRHSDNQEKGKSPGSWKFFKGYGQQRIEIIAKQNEKKQWVVLSCWSKLIGNNQPIFQKPSTLERIIHKALDQFFAKLQKEKPKS